MRVAALVVSALLLLPALPGVVRAQDEEAIDADYRSNDTIVVDGYAAPLVGTILEGGPGAPRVKIKTGGGVITEVAGDKVREWKLRETPESAFKARVTRLEKRKAGAPEHRLLAEWAVKHGLLDGAEAELTIAADGEPDAARAMKHRERLVDLLEQRLPELPAESADAVHEKVLRQVQKAEVAGAASPRLLLAKARVALAVGMPEVARAALGQAIAGLDATLKGAGPAPATEAPAPGTETETPAPGTEPAPPRRSWKGGRDGVGLDDDKAKQPVEAPPAAPEPAQDNSDALLSGLEPPQRDAWREALLLDAEAAARLGQLEDAQAAWERLLEVWPQERQATLGLAQLLVSFGARGAALDLLGQTLKVFPRDAELLLVRGQIRTLLAQSPADFEGPRQDLELALAAASQGRATPPTPAPGAPPRTTTVESLVREVRTALGLVLLLAGKFDEARAHLEAADVEPGHGPARLARALLAESQGNGAAARTHYEEAARLLAPKDGEARYGLAFVRAADDATAAQTALRDALREGHSAELVLRALEDLARRRNDGATEAKLLEVHVRSSDDPSPDLLARLARAWQAQERFDEARALLQRGLADAPDHLGCLRGLAWDAYRADDRDKARTLLVRVAAADPKDEWAKRALKNLEDVRTRRVWTDGFDRPGPDVKNSWIVEHSFGVEAGIADGKLYLHGKQANGVAPDGRTRVRRVISGEQVAKVEARMNLDALGSAFRGGLRLEASNGPGVVLFKDQDGRVKVSVASRKGDFSDPVDLGDCPTGLVTFGIELTDPKAGLVTLWVGGQPRGEPQKVSGLTGEVDVSLYVQGSQLGAETKLTVDEVRVFAVRAGGR
jgi:tetratricopeptide (TPR) repeat protein